MPRYIQFDLILNTDHHIRRHVLMREDLSYQHLADAIHRAFNWSTDNEGWFAPFNVADPLQALVGVGRPELGAAIATARDTPLTKHKDLWQGSASYYSGANAEWEHTIYHQGVVENDEVFERRLIWGRGANPPEACGGPIQYSRLRRMCINGRPPEASGDKQLLERWRDWEGWFDRERDFDLEANKARFDW